MSIFLPACVLVYLEVEVKSTMPLFERSTEL